MILHDFPSCIHASPQSIIITDGSDPIMSIPTRISCHTTPHDKGLSFIDHHFCLFIRADIHHFDMSNLSILLNSPKPIILIILNWNDLQSVTWEIPVPYEILIKISLVCNNICSFYIGSVWPICIIDYIPNYLLVYDYLGCFVGVDGVRTHVLYWLRHFVALLYLF